MQVSSVFNNTAACLADSALNRHSHIDATQLQIPKVGNSNNYLYKA